MAEWKLITEEVPKEDGSYLCTIEATEGERTWRFTAECDFLMDYNWFVLCDDTEYGEDCTMDKDEDWTGCWQPFSFPDLHHHLIHCRLIAWVSFPEPYTGDGYTGEINGAYSYACN